MELLDLLDNSVDLIVTELKSLRQENKELHNQVSGFYLVVTDVESLRLENENLKAQKIQDAQVNADNVNLQLENRTLHRLIDELNAKVEVQQNEFVLLKDELIQEHKVKDIVLNKVDILLNRLKEIKDVD